MTYNKIGKFGAALAVAGTLCVLSLQAAQPAAPGAGGPAGPAPAAAPAQPYVMPASIPAYIKKAVESPGRTAEMTKRDFDRKPAELLALAGVKPGDRVIEFGSFGQYITTLLSDIVGPKGAVYMYDLPYMESQTVAPSKAFVAAHPNAHFELGDFNAVELPNNIDGVYIVLYYHDLDLPKRDNSCCVVNAAKFNERVFKALKPGGTYLIVDHNAEAGSGRRDTAKIHRIDPAVIKQEVKAAGFELVEDSKLLAHPADDHTKMVFGGMRGVTDQAVLKFRKPLK